MPRNGSGSFSLAESPFVPNTPISSAAVNSDLSDIADALTDSLARDGQGGMTAVLPLANNGFTYLTDPNTGMRRTAADTQAISVGGVDAITITSTAVDVVGLKVGGQTAFPVPTAQIADGAVTLAKLYHPTAPSILLGSDSNPALVITGAAAAAGLIRLSVASTATFATGQVKTVSDVLGTTEANGTWTITVVDATHIDLQGSTFVNAYVSGGTIGGGVEEITIGSGLLLAGSVLKAPGIPGEFKNLSIKVASNTTVTVVADFVTTTNGTSLQTTAVSATINLGTSGAVNALDTGSIATSSWYSVWVIAKSDGTTGCLASLSATAPTLPAGYTFKARIGWVRTTTGSAILFVTWQLGRRAQYVVSNAGTTTVFPQIASGTNAFTPTASSVSNVVPTTASEIFVLTTTAVNTATAIGPNTSASASNSVQASNSTTNNMKTAASFLLEASTISYASNGSGNATDCLGWIDNV